MHRYLVTGTDTDVGKTRVTAILARALRLAGEKPTIVKLVQTGLAPGLSGDAARAGRLADTRFVELARFTKAADPWSAALAQGAATVHAHELADALESIPGAIVAEGAGGLMVPLNRARTFGHVAAKAKLAVVLAVGLRSGCLNHALLTHNLCEQFGLPVAGAVLVGRWRRRIGICEGSRTSAAGKAEDSWHSAVCRRRTRLGCVRRITLRPLGASRIKSCLIRRSISRVPAY